MILTQLGWLIFLDTRATLFMLSFVKYSGLSIIQTPNAKSDCSIRVF